MGLVQLSGANVEPVSLDETKAFLRIDGNAEDALVSSLILTSRLHIEAALGLALITQSWRMTLDAWPRDGVVGMPLAPVRAITQVRVNDGDGNAIELPASSYVLEATARPARLFAKDGPLPQPGVRAGGLEIDFTAGFSDTAAGVPEPIRQAIMLLVAHWYEHRDPIEIGAPATAVPHSVNRLLHPYQPVRL